MRAPKAPVRYFVLGVRVTEELKAEIEAAAAAKEWSISHWLNAAARDALVIPSGAGKRRAKARK
jgi:hypothetical protein